MNNLKKQLPIETNRLYLRLPEPGEAGLIRTYYEENRAHLESWEPEKPECFYKTAHWEKEIKNIHSQFFLGQTARLSMFLKEVPQGPIVGMCNFTNIIRGAFSACYLGYSIDYKHEGKGLMAEALEAAVDFMFEKFALHRVMANYMPRNERSKHLLEKLGFEIEGHARYYLKIAGEKEYI